MSYNYTLYPEALAKVKASGLEERITTLLKSDTRPDFYFRAFGGAEEYYALLGELGEKGYFKAAPLDFAECFFGKPHLPSEHFSKLRKLIDNPQDFKWEIKTRSGNIFQPVNLEDEFLILSGLYVSDLLKPEEFWDFKKYGFSSLSDFFGVLCAYMKMKARIPYKEGYKWQSKQGGRQFITEVSGSEHGDLRIFRTDITPYETLDPLGYEVLYRPELDADRQIVAGYHSVEPQLLAHIIKYHEQEGLKSEILENPGEFLNGFKRMPQYMGNFADFGYEEGISGSNMMFIGHDIPIPRFGKADSKMNFTRGIPCEFEGGYSFYVGEDKSLIFSHSNPKKQDKKQERNISMTIPSNEVDYLIRGLFVQAQKGLGRTSISQLCKVVEYYFSPQFKEDRKEEEEWAKESLQKKQ